MTKISDKVRKALRRIPGSGYGIACQAIDQVIEDTTSVCERATAAAFILAFIEVTGCGTGEKATIYRRFVESAQRQLNEAADTYGEAAAEGLCNKLSHQYGVNFRLNK